MSPARNRRSSFRVIGFASSGVRLDFFGVILAIHVVIRYIDVEGKWDWICFEGCLRG